MATTELTRRNFFRVGNSVALAAATTGLLSACSSSEAQSSQPWDTASNPQVNAQLSNGAKVSGYAAPAFRPVFDEFVRNFNERGEVGASVAITHKGVPVLEAWGGFSDTQSPTPSAAWQRDTVCVVFSSTKGATAMCAHLLAARGQLDLDARVTKYWPEFGANGKQDATVRMLLDHSVGLPALRDPVPARGWTDPAYMASRLAAESPWWEPGADHGYQAVTFGWLVGEVVRRVSGLSLGAYFEREIAQPLGLDFHIGTPASVYPRISPLIFSTEPTTDRFTQVAAADPKSIPALIGNMGDYLFHINDPVFWQSEVPAVSGITNAQSLAAMYTVMANGGRSAQGMQLVPSDYIQQMGYVQSASHIDRSLLIQTRFGSGYWNSMDNRSQPGKNLSFLIGRDAFGHPGFGGSFGFADPQANLAIGYAMNRMGPGIALNPRGQSLVDAAYKVLDYSSNEYGFWV